MPSAMPQTIGRYRVLSALGEGAMGEVVRARDERLGRDVAIKRVKNPGGEGAAEFQARFEAEARALAALAHPAVVQIFELGVDGDEPYLVMELVDGMSLRALIKERGALSEAEVRALGIQLARALEAAHARGILHRDVKPANVLRAMGSGTGSGSGSGTGSGSSGGWKLADFGVAHVPDSEMTSTGQFIGTPAYAAPEALALAQFSPASDVYGLAATLVEAASGKKPRKDATLAELMAKSHEGATLEGVGDELAAILRPALALDARARPSAGELAELLAGSPETGQILQAMAARAASGPAFVAAGEQETRVGGSKRKNVEAEAPAVHTVGVADESRAAATAALRGAPREASQHDGASSHPSLHTVAVPDETRGAPRAPSVPGTQSAPSLQVHAPTPTPVRMPHPIPMPPEIAAVTAAAAAHAAAMNATASNAVAMPPSDAPPRRTNTKQLIGGAVLLIVLLVVIGRACSEEQSGGALRFPAATTPGPGGNGGPGGPGGGELPPHLRGLQADPEAPLRFDAPPDLDRKGAQAWGEVARAIGEGKLGKALDKLEKFEKRAGESEESAKLRAWLEEHAGEEEGPPGPPHERPRPPHERDD